MSVRATAGALLVAACCNAASMPAAASTRSAPAIGSTSATPKRPAPAGNPCRRHKRRLRCPDLIMSAPSQLHIDRTTLPGRVLLRASSSIDNRGRGPLELRARRLGRHRWRVYEAIFDRRGRRHLFRTRATLVFKLVAGDRYEYGNVGAASYWKVRHAAAFLLWSVDRNLRAVRLVRRGPKVDYCLRDLVRSAPSWRSPPSPFYGGCSQDAGLGGDVLGTSVGWSDVYPYEYPEQWIDVTGLRGRFSFVQRADPDGLLYEANHRNDVSETYIELPSARVLGRRIAVSRP
jgi:hypothetical protein